jgi:hypothetical protein
MIGTALLQHSDSERTGVGTHLHFDCFSGISGDMTLGALVDAGASFSELKAGLKRLAVSGFTLRKRRVQRCHLRHESRCHHHFGSQTPVVFQAH